MFPSSQQNRKAMIVPQICDTPFPLRIFYARTTAFHFVLKEQRCNGKTVPAGCTARPPASRTATRDHRRALFPAGKPTEINLPKLQNIIDRPVG